MSMASFYCEPCLKEMGMEKNGSRYQAEREIMNGICRCCKEQDLVYNIRDFQRKRNSNKFRHASRKELHRPKARQNLRTWPEGLRFD